MSAKLTHEDVMQLLDKLYQQSVDGIQKISPPISQLAFDYLSKNPDIDTAAKSFIRYQIAKCTTSGFLSGLGGVMTLPVTIPANIGSVLYVQMRMIACLAHMSGYDTQSDQVQTLVYACLAGISVDQVLKNIGIQFGIKMANAGIKKLPKAVLVKINQSVGFRLVTKFGSKGLINLGKAIPIVGGVIGGGFDLVETKIIAARAYKMFIQGDFSLPTDSKDQPDITIDPEDFLETEEA